MKNCNDEFEPQSGATSHSSPALRVDEEPARLREVVLTCLIQNHELPRVTCFETYGYLTRAASVLRPFVFNP